MKKFITLSLLAFFAISCSRQGPAGPPGPQGPQGQPGESALFTIIEFSTFPQDWQPFNFPGDPDYQYFIEFTAPEIDAYAYDNAMVQGYLIENDGTIYPLPNTVNFGNYIREYSMYYGLGYIGFIVKDSDLQTTAPNNELVYRVYITEPRGKKAGVESWSTTELQKFADENPDKVHYQKYNKPITGLKRPSENI